MAGSARGKQIGWNAGYPPCSPPDLRFALLHTLSYFRRLIFLSWAPLPLASGCVWPMGTFARRFGNWRVVRAGYINPWIFLASPHSWGGSGFPHLRLCSCWVTLFICFHALSFRNCSFPYSFCPRAGNHSSLTPVAPEYYIISLFPNIYYNKSSYITIKKSLCWLYWRLHFLFPIHPWLIKVVRQVLFDEVMDDVSLEECIHEEDI